MEGHGDHSAYRNYKVGPVTVSVTPGDVEIATRPIGRELRASDDARACLENLSASRRRGRVSRALGQEALELELDKIMTLKGEDYVNAIRREANTIAPQLGLQQEAERLEAVIGALCATRPGALGEPPGTGLAFWARRRNTVGGTLSSILKQPGLGRRDSHAIRNRH